jgi:hypothetical protein
MLLRRTQLAFIALNLAQAQQAERDLRMGLT